jgi:drug/metabolite transporter (DMT)-like permease
VAAGGGGRSGLVCLPGPGPALRPYVRRPAHSDWPVYAFIAATVTGTLLQQAALHVGPLSVSQPFLVITDPFASIVLSVWLFDERFTDSPAKITVAVLAFAVMAVGVTILTRTAPKDLTPS